MYTIHSKTKNGITPLEEKVLKGLSQLETHHLIRHISPFSTAQLPVAKVNNIDKLLFSSSNYLSLSESSALIDAATTAVKVYGTSSGGSRLTTGTHGYHQKLEETLRKAFNYDSALLFNSGYDANLGVISALCDAKTEIFSDDKNHASIIDGIRLSKAKQTDYPHLNLHALEETLKQSTYAKKLIISDGVFSMDGDIAPLPELRLLADKYGALLMIDDAHGIGVIGNHGLGVVDYFNELSRDFSGTTTTQSKGSQPIYVPDILIGTLSKALGSEGGFALSNANIGKFLLHKARSFIFSSALNAGAIAAALKGFELIATQQPKLQKNITILGDLLVQHKLIDSYTLTAIFPIHIGDEAKAMTIAQKLNDKGILVTPIRFPSVSKGHAILRVTVMASHTKEQLETLVNMLKKALKN